MAAWITAADVQAQLGADVVDLTAASALADAATSAVRDLIERDLELQTYTELLDSNGTDYILLANWPIVSVTSVSIYGLPPLVPAALNTPGWQLDAFIARKLRFAGIGKIPRATNNITVVYSAGYDFTAQADARNSAIKSNGGGPPPNLVKALALTAAAIENAKAADPNLVSESTGGVFSGGFHSGGVGSVPPGAQSLLRPYMRVAP